MGKARSIAAAGYDRVNLSRISMGGVAIIVVGVLIGGLSQLKIETSESSFLPAQDSTVQQYEQTARSFGGDPVVVLLESKDPSRLLGPDNLPKLLKLEGQLSALPDSAVVYGPGTTLNQVAGGAQNFLAEISGRRDGLRAAAEAEATKNKLSPQAVHAAGERALSDFDQRYGSLLVRGLPAGLPTLHNPAFVKSVLFNQSGLPKPQWHFVVPNRNAVAILVRPRQNLDQAGTARLVSGVRKAVGGANLDADRTTVSGVPVVADDLGTKIAQETPILGGVALALVTALFLCVPWTRRRRRVVPLLAAVVASAGTLAIFGWIHRPISLGVVAFLPVLLGIGSDFPAYLVQRANWRVVSAVAIATSAGFATLMMSPLPFVRDLGGALSIGIILSASIGFALSRHSRCFGDRGDVTARSETPNKLVSHRSRIVIGLVLVGTAIAGWVTLPLLSVQANPANLASGMSTVDAANRVENVMGSSGEMDLVLHGRDVRSPQAIEWMRRAEDAIVTRYGDQMRPVLSPPDLFRFLGGSPTPEQVQSALRLTPPYLTGAVMRDDGRSALASFGVRMEDLQDLAHLRDGVRKAIPPPPPGDRVELTGLPNVAIRGYELLSNGRYASNLLGIVATGAVLALALRRRSDAVLAVITAFLATGIGLGLLWLFAVPFTPLTVGLGSLTAAVGCEFTILLAEAKRNRDRSLRRSVILAATTSATGYAVLSFSSVSVLQQFGILLTCSVSLSLVCGLCVVQIVGDKGAGGNDKIRNCSDYLGAVGLESEYD